MCNCTSEDAPLGAGPESILPVVVMDSGLARSLSSGRALRGPVGAPRNDAICTRHPRPETRRAWQRGARQDLSGSDHRAQTGPRTRAQSRHQDPREMSTTRHPLYTSVNPAIVAALTTLGDDMDDEKPVLEQMTDAMSSAAEATKEAAKTAVKKVRKAAKRVAKKVTAKKKAAKKSRTAKKAKKAGKKSSAKK